MLVQFIINGIIAGCIYALVALGFSLVYQTTRFFHFAHGGMYTVGAYVACYVVDSGGTIYFGLFCSVFVAAVLGALVDLLVYRPLVKRQASKMVLFLASLGVYVLLQNSISLIFGDGTRVLRHPDAGSAMTIVGGSITSVQVIIILATMALWLATGAVLRFTRAGRVLRAVANDLELSRIVGINADWVITATVMIGSSLAAVAGVLVALDSNATPVMGFKALLGGVVAVIVGGVGNIMGAVFGGLFVGLAQHLGVWKLSTQWQDTILFLIMIVVLVIRPEGFKRKTSGTSRV